MDELERLLAASPEPAPAVGARDLTAMRELRQPLPAAFEAAAVDAFAAAVNPLLARSPGGWQMAAALGLSAARPLEQRAALARLCHLRLGSVHGSETPG